MYIFKVPKMSCGGCASGIKRALLQIDGDAQVDIDIAGKTVKVQSAMDQSLLIEAMAKAGYPPMLD
jgi:copper chaperone